MVLAPPNDLPRVAVRTSVRVRFAAAEAMQAATVDSDINVFAIRRPSPDGPEEHGRL